MQNTLVRLIVPIMSHYQSCIKVICVLHIMYILVSDVLRALQLHQHVLIALQFTQLSMHSDRFKILNVCKDGAM